MKAIVLWAVIGIVLPVGLIFVSREGSFSARGEQLLHPGYSTCHRCHRPWATVKAHVTNYSEIWGMFPLCDGCWSVLTIEQRLPFYRELFDEWGEGGGADGTARWEDIEAAVSARK